jgi:hypothetical protein
MIEDRLRRHFDHYLGKAEVVVYSVLALLLAITALVTLATAGEILWTGSVTGRLRRRHCAY